MIKTITLILFMGTVYMYHNALANKGILLTTKGKIATRAMCFVAGICIALM